MLHLYRPPLTVFVVLVLLATLLYQTAGVVKPVAGWQWMDIAGEGGTALMAAIWLLQILSSRPRGRVTTLLAFGLAGIALGSWADCLDEFYKLPDTTLWDNWLESVLSPAGMLCLTIGLFFWREEQFVLNEHLVKRERLFREHRAFDRLTQLANADYLRRQIVLEQTRQPDRPCGLILLDIDDFHAINREYGAAEGDRVLQALSHLLLLNLRHADLLCRYAGDRFAILLPETDSVQTAAIAQHLRGTVSHLAYHARRDAKRLPLTARVVSAVADRSPDALLDALNAALEPAVATPPRTAHA